MVNALIALLLITCAQGKKKKKDDPNEPPPQEEINKALDRGGAKLLRLAQGGLPADVHISWGRGNTYDALVLYAMHHAGVNPKEQGFAKLVERVAEMTIESTYMPLPGLAFGNLCPLHES